MTVVTSKRSIYIRQTGRYVWQWALVEEGRRLSDQKSDGWALTQYGAYCKARRWKNRLERNDRIRSTEWKYYHSGSFR